MEPQRKILKTSVNNNNNNNEKPSSFPQKTKVQQEAHQQKRDTLVMGLIQACIEQLLYHRNIYPPDSFRKVTAFGLEIFTNRHPGVQAYLQGLMVKLSKFNNSGDLNRLLISIYNKDTDTTLETFGFGIKKPNPDLVYSQDETPAQGSSAESETMLFAEFQSVLHGITNDLANTGKDVSSHGNLGFKVGISANSSLFGDLAHSSDWILDKTNLKKTDDTRLISLAKSTANKAFYCKEIEFDNFSLKYYRASKQSKKVRFSNK
ncbi:unnamed protein product [Ambrosiozyma monospora]|uniref:Unnamed protein product n=1 Tax=Ambrosiozyma monospora TaxID=43982 RepID=A0ACB5SRJ1_AMBMO|nr:unnamed protein product [Ambrosiozyma monospora]